MRDPPSDLRGRLRSLESQGGRSTRIRWPHCRWVRGRCVKLEYVDLPAPLAQQYHELDEEVRTRLAQLDLLPEATDPLEFQIEFYDRVSRALDPELESNPERAHPNECLDGLMRASELSRECLQLVWSHIASTERRAR